MAGSFSAEAQAFVGMPGSGKSYSATVRLLDWLLQRRRPVFTNLEIRKFAIGNFCREKSSLKKFDDGKEIDFREYDFEQHLHQFRFCPCVEQFEWGAKEMTAPPSKIEGGIWETGINFWEWIPEDSLFILDEPHFYFPQERWQELARHHPQMKNWLSTHRHYGVEIIYMTQKWTMLARQLKDTCGMIYQFHDMSKVKMGWFKYQTPQRFFWSKFYSDIAGKSIDHGDITPNPEIFKCYRSKSQALGTIARRPIDDIKPETGRATAREAPKSWLGSVFAWFRAQPVRASVVVGGLAFLIIAGCRSGVETKKNLTGGKPAGSSVQIGAPAARPPVVQIGPAARSAVNGAPEVSATRFSGTAGDYAFIGSAMVRRGESFAGWVLVDLSPNSALFQRGEERRLLPVGASL